MEKEKKFQIYYIESDLYKRFDISRVKLASYKSNYLNSLKNTFLFGKKPNIFEFAYNNMFTPNEPKIRTNQELQEMTLDNLYKYEEELKKAIDHNKVLCKKFYVNSGTFGTWFIGNNEQYYFSEI